MYTKIDTSMEYFIIRFDKKYAHLVAKHGFSVMMTELRDSSDYFQEFIFENDTPAYTNEVSEYHYPEKIDFKKVEAILKDALDNFDLKKHFDRFEQVAIFRLTS